MVKKTVRIEVTARDLAEGSPCHAYRCAVALAVRRALPDVGMVGVGTEQVLLDGRVVSLPFDAGEAIAAFDRGERVEPFAFDLAYEGEV